MTVLNSSPSEEFKKLLPTLGDTSKWTAADRATYFAFFCHGWYGRANEAAYQEDKRIPMTIDTTLNVLTYKSEAGHTMQRELDEPFNGKWVLRVPSGSVVDYDSYRNSLAEKYNFVIVDGCTNET